MTTAYNLIDTIIQPCKRLNKTNISAFIIRFIFGDSPVKDLFISVAIDIYNHHMVGGDIANQY